AVDRLLPIEHGVAAVAALAFRRVGPHHVAHAAHGGIERMDRLDLLAHQPAHVRRQRATAARAQSAEPGIGALRLDDGVEVAAISDVERKRAEAWDVDAYGFRRQIARHIADAHALHALAALHVTHLDLAGRRFGNEPAGRA